MSSLGMPMCCVIQAERIHSECGMMTRMSGCFCESSFESHPHVPDSRLLAVLREFQSDMQLEVGFVHLRIFGNLGLPVCVMRKFLSLFQRGLQNILPSEMGVGCVYLKRCDKRWRAADSPSLRARWTRKLFRKKGPWVSTPLRYPCTPRSRGLNEPKLDRLSCLRLVRAC